MILPTDEQVSRAAELLRKLRMEHRNIRPGDQMMTSFPDGEDQRQQYRARATDMLVILLNQEGVFHG